MSNTLLKCSAHWTWLFSTSLYVLPNIQYIKFTFPLPTDFIIPSWEAIRFWGQDSLFTALSLPVADDFIILHMTPDFFSPGICSILLKKFKSIEEIFSFSLQHLCHFSKSVIILFSVFFTSRPLHHDCRSRWWARPRKTQCPSSYLLGHIHRTLLC